MIPILLKLIKKARVHFFPTKNEMQFRKWEQDGGDEKFRYEFDLNSESVVFDLGGYKGQWASDIFAKYLCKVLVFEPVTSFSNNIKNRFNKNENIQVYGFALGATNRQEYISVVADGSSIFQKNGIQEKINFVDIVSFNEINQINKIDLMKINIEGGEYELLPRMIESGIIDKIKLLQIQFHEISEDSLSQMNKIREKLKSTHNQVFAYPFVWECWINKG